MTTRLSALFSLPGLVLCAAAQSASPAAVRRVVIPAAARVDLSCLGAHTHKDFIRFDLGRLDLGRLDLAHVPGLRLVAHCRLGTDHAALPPGFGALMRDVGPVPTLGPIERWEIAPDHRSGRDGVRVTVPTRFANWVAGQPPALRRRYRSPHSYTLEIDRPAPGAG